MGAFLVHGEGRFGVEVLLAKIAFVFAGVIVSAENVLPARRHRLKRLLAVDADENGDAVVVKFARTVTVAAGVVVVALWDKTRSF